MVGLVFVLNAFCYAYLNVELGSDILKRLKKGMRG